MPQLSTRYNPFIFHRNVAAHVINVRGHGQRHNGVGSFGFRVTLVSRISAQECAAVGLGYRDPESLREEDFRDPHYLWIAEGGHWLYARR